MLTKIKNTLQTVAIIVLVVQLVGCILVDRGHHGYRGHPWHHGHDSDPSIDIRLYG